MLRLVSGSNDVVVTLTENSTVTDPIYLFRFFNQQNNTNYYVIQPSDTSEFKQRYNRFDIILTADPNTLAGEIDLPLNGFYNYEVYQTSLSVPFSISEASEAVDYVVKSVEKGIAFVVFDATQTETFEPASVEYKVYDPDATPDLHLEMEFNSIANVPASITDPSNVSQWNTFFDLPTNGSAFQSAHTNGSTVLLSGGSGITVKDSLFGSNLNLIKILDNNGVIVATGSFAFYGCHNLTEVYFPAVANIGQSSFMSCLALSEFHFPAATIVGNGAFRKDSSAQSSPAVISYDLTSCVTLGSSVLQNLVFSNVIGKTITITIPSALMTCNSGQPDGDIQYLQANNTVTIIEA